MRRTSMTRTLCWAAETRLQDCGVRWANLDVSYLWQRFEHSLGMRVLTPNLSMKIDTPFLRRVSVAQ